MCMFRWKTKFLTRQQAYEFELRRQRGETIKSILSEVCASSYEYDKARGDMKLYEKMAKDRLMYEDTLNKIGKEI